MTLQQPWLGWLPAMYPQKWYDKLVVYPLLRKKLKVMGLKMEELPAVPPPPVI